MNDQNDSALPRSPLLLDRASSALLVVDVQEKLISLIPNHQRLCWNIRRLLDAAKLFDVRSVATEQYPKGLGPTTSELAERLSDPALEKTRFSCGECGSQFAGLMDDGIRQIVVVGIESHVCVQQTVLDLLTAGFDPYVVVDAVGSRFAVDHDTAMRRMELAGAYLTSTESVMFEWCEHSKADGFKEMSQLIREKPPVE